MNNQKGFVAVLYAGLLALLGVALWLIWQLPRPEAGAVPVKPASTAAEKVSGKSVELPKPAVKPIRRFALVIDDVGSQKDLSRFLALDVPITFAIIPFERYSKNIAADLSSRNMPFIIHMPMEPESYPANNPGSKPLLVSLSGQEIGIRLASSLDAVPGASGVSNHMGSRFTADEGRMRLAMQTVRQRGLFFFDSVTTPRTRARAAARATGVNCLSNDLFVDLKDDPDFMDRQFSHIIKRLERGGTYIAIGHVHKKNMAPAIARAIPRFRDAGIEFVFLTDILPENSQVARSK